MVLRVKPGMSFDVSDADDDDDDDDDSNYHDTDDNGDDNKPNRIFCTPNHSTHSDNNWMCSIMNSMNSNSKQLGLAA